MLKLNNSFTKISLLMGHYDTCYAADWAKKQGPVTELEKASLRTRMEAERSISGYTEDSGHVRLQMVAQECPEFAVQSSGYKQFIIVYVDQPD